MHSIEMYLEKKLFDVNYRFKAKLEERLEAALLSQVCVHNCC